MLAEENSSSIDDKAEIPTNFSLPTFDSILELRAASYVYKVGLPLVILAGLFGNTMIVVIQRRLNDAHDQSLSLYFTALALSDIVSLMVNPVFMVIDSYNVNLNVFLDIPTKIRGWVVYTTSWVSPWLLVAMTAQRAASIVWPHKIKTLDSKRRSRTFVFALVSFSAISQAHILYGHEERDVKLDLTVVNSFDFVDDEYRSFFEVVWTRVHMTFSVLIPFALIIAFNIVLIRAVTRSVRDSEVKFGAGNSGVLKARGKKASSMTVRLISVSVAFLVLISPISVIYILQEIISFSAITDIGTAATVQLTYSIAIFMWYANFAVNFYVYCLTGRKYREECINVLSCASSKQTAVNISLKQNNIPKRG